jgi:hypothetical protein
MKRYYQDYRIDIRKRKPKGGNNLWQILLRLTN